MPKYPTFPDCFDEVKQVSITCLKSLDYLRPDVEASGVIRWTRNGEPSGSIFVRVSWPDRYVELDYKSNDTPIKYRVSLQHVPLHFGGYKTYFICPSTGKRCSKLYGIGKYFLSRFAYPSAMYSKQTESKYGRGLYRCFEASRLLEEHEQKPYSRTYYKGKLTKRYERILSRAERPSNRTSLLRSLNRS